MPRKRSQIIHLLQQTVALQTPVLDLSNCNAGDLLEQVCQMNWLTEINLSHAHVSSLPDTFGNLTVLTRLDLSQNQLATLPESIVHLTTLEYLNLSHAGYEFNISEPLTEWIKNIADVIWTTSPIPIAEPEPYIYSMPDHPNQWLVRIKQALKLYNDAFNMEERGFDGTNARTEADADIQQIFRQIAELERLFPEFYDDFKQHRFYWSSRESEKTIDSNPFRLPTKADEEWLVNADLADLLPIHLLDEILDGCRTIFTANTRTGQQSEVFECEYGGVLLLNQPYAEDVTYQADCEAQLYQAGSERLYVRATLYGSGKIPGTEWFGSDNGGQSWQKQAYLTYDWLNDNYHHWRELGNLSRRE